MKKQTTNAICKNGIDQVEGHQVKFDGFEEFKFTIHRPIYHNGIKLIKEKTGWQITENSTGRTVIKDYDTTKAKITIDAKAKLERCGIVKLRKYVSENLIEFINDNNRI